MEDKDFGFIMLHRKFRDNFLWQQKREFSKAEAWIDLLMEVRWDDSEPDKALIDGRMITCGYAQSLNSTVTWAKRWGWTRFKVMRFLKLLEQDSMIKTETPAHKTTRITIVNYKRYHSKRTRDAHETHMRRTRDAHETHIEEEVKEVKEVKEETPKEKQERIEAEVQLDIDIDDVLYRFETKVKSRRDDKSGSLSTRKNAIATILKTGITKETLFESIDNYEEANRGTEPKFRKGAQSYFGIKYKTWKDFLGNNWRGPEGPTGPVDPNGGVSSREDPSKFDGLD